MVLINGKNYDHGNCVLIMFGTPVTGWTEIDYEVDQQKEMNYGPGYEPVSYGFGQKKYTGSVTLYTDELRDIINSQPATQNRDFLAIGLSTVVVQFEGANVPFTEDILTNVMFTKNPFATKSGDTRLLVKIPFVFAGLQQ